jgi:serine/threonine protein kinase
MQSEARKRTSERLRAEANIPSSDPSSLNAGQTVGGRYRLVRALDRKQRIWRATDEAGRSVVLKSGIESSIEREYRVLSALSHRNIIGTAGRVDGDSGSFIILDYLAGGDLVSLAGLSPRHWLRPIGDVIDALDYLHGHRLVHRDLKARNVLLDTGNRARLIDFESALPAGSRWTAGGTTESIVRPERGDRPVTAADDDYALACLLHEMLYGMPPGTTARKPVPAWLAPLAGLVDASLEATGISVGPDLRRFSAVVELLKEQRPDLQ